MERASVATADAPKRILLAYVGHIDRRIMTPWTASISLVWGSWQRPSHPRVSRQAPILELIPSDRSSTARVGQRRRPLSHDRIDYPPLPLCPRKYQFAVAKDAQRQMRQWADVLRLHKPARRNAAEPTEEPSGDILKLLGQQAG